MVGEADTILRCPASRFVPHNAGSSLRAREEQISRDYAGQPGTRDTWATRQSKAVWQGDDGGMTDDE